MIERFAPGLGGVENVAWQVAHELARQCEAVTVLARESPRLEQNVRSESTDSSPRVELVRCPRFWQPLRVALFSHRSAEQTRRGAFDVVHGFARTRHQDLYRAGGGSHADYLRRNHSGLALAARRLSPRHRTLLALERRVFGDPRQRIQCASRLVADGLVNECGVDRERILLIPNAVDAQAFDDPQVVRAGARLRAEWGGGAERVWLLPGSGWHRKGLATLLEATALSGDPGLHVWVAGRDRVAPWRARADALGLGPRVRFLGERRDLAAVYHAADGMILPTRYDPFANVTLEAAAAGRPIITSAANGAAEWLRGEVEVVANPSDAAAYAAALNGFRSPARRREVGNRLRLHAREFDWPSHVARLREEYRHILASRPRREGARS